MVLNDSALDLHLEGAWFIP